MKAAGRFGAPAGPGNAPPFNHLQSQQQQAGQHHAIPFRPAPNSNNANNAPPQGLPPPSFSQAFSQGSHNPFAVTGNVNGLAAGFGMSHVGNGGTGLGSKEAQEGFAYGAQLQAREQRQGKVMPRSKYAGPAAQQDFRIRDVWAANLGEEMDLLEQLIRRFPYVSMDTEFPGIVARPMGRFTTKADYHYQCLRCNVDILKIIQLGISLFDEHGNLPPVNLADMADLKISANMRQRPCPTTWQFNFQFSLNDDMYNDSSITFLQDAGIDLKRFEHEGIQPSKFGSRLITSGLVHFDSVRWISFHSGYDFAYIVKLMNCNQLPEEESDYRSLLRLYFPAIYDVKYMMQHAQRSHRINDDQVLSPEAMNHLKNLAQKGGLQHLADELHVRRIGHAHCAGSDALLTGQTFWEVKDKIFGGTIDDQMYLGQVWGLNVAGTGMAPPPLPSLPSISAQEFVPTPNLNGATLYHPHHHHPQQQPQQSHPHPQPHPQSHHPSQHPSQSHHHGHHHQHHQLQPQSQSQSQYQPHASESHHHHQKRLSTASKAQQHQASHYPFQPQPASQPYPGSQQQSNAPQSHLQNKGQQQDQREQHDSNAQGQPASSTAKPPSTPVNGQAVPASSTNPTTSGGNSKAQTSSTTSNPNATAPNVSGTTSNHQAQQSRESNVSSNPGSGSGSGNTGVGASGSSGSTGINSSSWTPGGGGGVFGAFRRN